MDIRSYFKPANQKSSKAGVPPKKISKRERSDDDDDDVVVYATPEPKKKKPVKKAREKRALSDSDNEISEKKTSTKAKTPSKRPEKKIKSTEKTVKKQEKLISVSDSDEDFVEKKSNGKTKTPSKKQEKKSKVPSPSPKKIIKKKPVEVTLSESDEETPKKQYLKSKGKKSDKKRPLSDTDEDTPPKKNPIKPKSAEKSAEKVAKTMSIPLMFANTPVKRIKAPEKTPKKLEVKETDSPDDLKKSEIKASDSHKDHKKEKLKESDFHDDLKKSEIKASDSQKDSKKEKLKESDPHDDLKKSEIKASDSQKDSKKEKLKESDFHDDPDFLATLEQADNVDYESFFSSKPETKESGKRKKEHSDDEAAAQKKAKYENDIKVKKEKTPVKISNKKEDKNKSEVDEIANGAVKKSPNNKKESKKKGTKHEVVFEKKKKENKKVENEPDDEVDVYEERIQQKKQHVAAYQQYLQRGGARNPGSKEIPEGAKNCLAGLTFVITGVLDSLERFEVDELVQKYGGRIVSALSSKVNYLVVGDGAGESKVTKATSMRIKQISEDDLLELIRTRPAGQACNIIRSRAKKNKSGHDLNDSFVADEELPGTSTKLEDSPENKKDSPMEKKKLEDTPGKKKESPVEKKKTPSPPKKENSPKEKVVDKKMEDSLNNKKEIPSSSFDGFTTTEALVEKYRPKTLKKIIGQQGDKSNAYKLQKWLKNWHVNQKGKIKPPRPSLYAKNDDGAFFKACLLSGPPGIGKTTTVQVICNELGYDLLEFNASDTRSKRLLKEEVSSILNNTTVKDHFSVNKNSVKKSTNHVILMDEVDGMAGNEDRGGLQELISLIKSTEIPIVCICNDRKNQKMKTLANYTFDLQFQKPKLEQIRGAMKSICWSEKIKIENDDLDRLIESSDRDIRQIINHLAMMVTNSETKVSNKIIKDQKIGPWEVVKKVFSAEEHRNMSIHDKSNLFFQDYQIGSLFVQENYLTVVPKAPKNETLERIASSAESLSIGDLLENAIRGKDAWSLLPMQACFSSVIPGSLMSGNFTSTINFPGWFGRNSKSQKFSRLLTEIAVHTRINTGASKDAITMDYSAALRDAIMKPLIINGSDGVEKAVDRMIHYQLMREDLDSLVEVSLWPGQKDPMQSVESKVKAAFTRMFNKKAPLTAFDISTAVKSKKKSVKATQESGFVNSEEEEDDEDSGRESDQDNVGIDKMIKVKKSTSNAGASTSKGRGNPTSKRGRGRGRGK